MEKTNYLPYLQRIKHRLGFDFVGIARVLEGNRPMLTWVQATGNKNRYFRRIVLNSGKGIAGGVYAKKCAMVIQDVENALSKEELAEHPILISEELKSVIAVPLWKKDQVQGVLLMGVRCVGCITKEVFERVMEELALGFAEFSVNSEAFEDAIYTRQNKGYVPVPIYELMNYPVMKAREEERRRIARDLHDGVLQNVLGVQMTLRTIKYQPDQESVQKILSDVDGWLSKIQDELRGISTSLRPTSLDDLGLKAALISQFHRVERLNPIHVDFIENIGEHRYKSSIETAFYRICQEAVLNACKYARCETICVMLRETEHHLILEVVDNGVGFDVDKPEIKGGGLGLSDMVDWAEYVDGRLDICSSPGVGSGIRLTVPIERGKKL